MQMVNRKVVGSVVFGTNTVKEHEYVLMAKSMRERMPLPEVVNTIEFIDDCLTVMKVQKTIGMRKHVRFTETGTVRKSMSLREFLSKRVDKLIEDNKNG